MADEYAVLGVEVGGGGDGHAPAATGLQPPAQTMPPSASGPGLSPAGAQAIAPAATTQQQRPPEWDDWNPQARDTYDYLVHNSYDPTTAREMAWRMQLYGNVDREAPIGPKPGAVSDAEIARQMPAGVNSLGDDARHDYIQLRQMGWDKDQASHAIMPGPINPVTGTSGLHDIADGRIGDLRPGLVEGSPEFHGRSGGQHEGVDIAAPLGTPVQAANSGTVVWKGFIKGYGNTVIVNQDDGYQTLYGHLDSYAADLKSGQRVVMGDPVGAAGHTGNASYADRYPAESHLHFAVRPLPAPSVPVKGVKFGDPVAYLNTTGE
jgi:murein DD-endopeptidase MepM/ murein hydrolase activator NlpD